MRGSFLLVSEVRHTESLSSLSRVLRLSLSTSLYIILIYFFLQILKFVLQCLITIEVWPYLRKEI